jgi:TM2 domain-containing membrane protein YozV
MALISCPECSKEISSAAVSCPNCGHPMMRAPEPQQVVQQVVVSKPSNGVAALLSLLIPGAGQMYKGSVGTGLVWMFVVVIGYCAFIVPGVILHLICILMAASD